MTTEPCVMLDPYRHPVACDVTDPCVGDSTLYRAGDCGATNPPLAVWCVGYPGHPVCPVVAVGEPPVPSLPPTGGPVGFGAALVLLAVGAVLLFAVRPNWRRKAPVCPSAACAARWALPVSTQPRKSAHSGHERNSDAPTA